MTAHACAVALRGDTLGLPDAPNLLDDAEVVRGVRGVRGIRGVRGRSLRALPGGVGAADPAPVRLDTAKLRRAEMEEPLSCPRDAWPLAEPDDPGRSSGVVASLSTVDPETGRDPGTDREPETGRDPEAGRAVCRSSPRLLSKSW